jgi:hypothetical protein
VNVTYDDGVIRVDLASEMDSMEWETASAGNVSARSKQAQYL